MAGTIHVTKTVSYMDNEGKTVELSIGLETDAENVKDPIDVANLQEKVDEVFKPYMAGEELDVAEWN